jgi:hypothetical protein
MENFHRRVATATLASDIGAELAEKLIKRDGVLSEEEHCPESLTRPLYSRFWNASRVCKSDTTLVPND